MKKYLTVSSVFYKISKILAYISMASMLFISILTTVDVVLRLLSGVTPLNIYVQGTYEITQLFMTLIVFLAYAVTEWDDGHVKVTIITSKLPKLPANVLKIIVDGIIMIFSAVLTYCAYQQMMTYMSGRITSSVLFIPFTPFAFCMTIGFLLFTISFVFKFINSIITLKKGNDSWSQEMVK